MAEGTEKLTWKEKHPSALKHDELVKATAHKIRYHPFGVAKTLFSVHDDEVLLAGAAGCLDGSTTWVVYNRGIRNSGRSITLSELYLKFNGLLSSNPPPWDLTLPTYLHSLGEDGVMFYNRIVAVYQSGVKSLVRVDFLNRMPLLATPDHPILTPSGYVQAGSLKGGDRVMSKGLMTARSSGGRDLSARPPRVIVNCKYHPYGSAKLVSGYVYTRVPRSRLVVEADLNGVSYGEFVWALKHDPELSESFRYVPTDFEVHHEDQDTLNDDIGNLRVLSKAEHAKQHNQKANFRFASTSEATVWKVAGAGEDMTYDVQMESPANNFCANGIVVHNTGKSLAALHKVHLCMSKYPKAKAFMARKTRSSMTNSCIETFERHVLQPPDKVRFHATDQQYNYPNGSMIAVLGMDDPEKVKSTDWDMGYIQEATECTENDWEIATTRLRNWVMPYQQLLADCNPDRPTHWLKKRCDSGLTKMLISRHEDNPKLWNIKTGQWTLEGLQYLAKLQRLTGVRRERLYEGKWVAAEGMIFTTWNENIHLIDPAQLPAGWESFPHYWSIDFGFTHPFVWQDWIEDPATGALYRLREIYMTRELIEDVAREIMELTAHLYVPRAIICDHDAEDRATFERHTGYLTLPAYKDIRQGIQALQKRLGPNWKEGRPGIYYVRGALVRVDRELEEAGKPTCTEQEYDGYVWDEKANRDVNSKRDELPIDRDNHGLDPSRYMVAFIDSLADDPEEIEGIYIPESEGLIISPY